ncbi:MAG: hypothetical protein K8R54_08900 [Bacteroidales bacterium]|nr:hypothetical protein [Bacteroidales bacterium]
MQIENKIKYSALIIFILTAYFSIGHHHSDEYFQILEFAQYKLGHINANELPWEFHEKMRPSFQPWLACAAIKSLNFIKVSNPFTIITIIRIFSALFLWFVISKLNKIICKKYFPDRRWSSLFCISSFFLWFVPYISVRFSSENYAQVFLLLSLCFLMKEHKSYRSLLSIGVFLALSVLFRYQMGIAVVGIFFWIIFKTKIPFSKLIFSIISFALIIVVGVYLDYLFYNEFVLTSFNYLKLNLIEGKASDFGTSPWWYYIVVFLGVAGPPISIVLLASFLIGTKKLRNDLSVWIIIPFILVHFILAHKEMRFLFPISYLFIFISIYGLKEYFKNRKIKRFHRRLFNVSVGINVVLLLFMMFRPANEMAADYRYLYNNLDIGNRTILTLEKDIYKLMAGLKSTFYTPDTYFSDYVESEAELISYLEEKRINSCFFVYGKFDFEGKIEEYNIEKVYSVYPNWIKNIKWIDWQKTLNTHSVFLLTRKETD